MACKRKSREEKWALSAGFQERLAEIRNEGDEERNVSPMGSGGSHSTLNFEMIKTSPYGPRMETTKKTKTISEKSSFQRV